LEEAGIPIDFVAGTSVGSLVGGVYASGRMESLRETLLQLEWKEILHYFFELSVPRGGLIDGKRIVEFIREYVTDSDMQDLPIPFRAVATDVMTGREVVLTDGPLMEAIRCSIAMPGIFTPVLRGGAALVDGGLVNPVPVSVVRDMGAEFVVAVDINSNRLAPPPEVPKAEDAAPEPPSQEWRRRLSDSMNRRMEKLDSKLKSQLHRWTRGDSGPNIFDVLGNTIRIMEAQISESMLQVSKPDILIRPAVGHISFMEFNRAAEAIRAGHKAARAELEGARKRIGA
jgi:NTE family protein